MGISGLRQDGQRNVRGRQDMIIMMKKTFGRSAKASLTIEAAIALPLFMFFIMAMSYFLIIISLQTDIRLCMDEAARSLGKQAYMAQETDAGASVSYFTIRNAVITDDLKERLDNSRIVGGSDGLNMTYSGYDEESGILDIVVCYSYEIPFFSDIVGNLRFIQRVRCRAWLGGDLSGSGADDLEGQIVYITPSGTVYHLTMSCPYLDLSISSIAYEDVSSARNKNGQQYTKCSSCFNAASDTVYITDYGTKYHSSLSCSALKRTVIAIDMSEAGDRSACSKCGGQ